MKNINEFFKKDLNNSLLVGYYGGGNFGDELILEILLHKFNNKEYKNIKVFYLDNVDFAKYHTVFPDIKVVKAKNKFIFLLESLKSKNIIIGGGGIWGLDINFNVVILSIYLLVMRYIFFKRIYLIGVGFYNSTTPTGKFAGRLAGVAANLVVARDKETYNNFFGSTKNLYIDQDIAFLLKEFQEPPMSIRAEIRRLEDVLKIKETEVKKTKYIFLVFRGSYTKGMDYFLRIFEDCLAIPNVSCTLCLIQHFLCDKRNLEIIQYMNRRYPKNLFYLVCNPLAIFFLFKQYYKNILLIAPQYHLQLIAYLTNTSFMPISYDNKCDELFNILGIKDYYGFNELTSAEVVRFINLNK